MTCTVLWKLAHCETNTKHVNNDVVFSEGGTWLFWRNLWHAWKKTKTNLFFVYDVNELMLVGMVIILIIMMTQLFSFTTNIVVIVWLPWSKNVSKSWWRWLFGFQEQNVTDYHKMVAIITLTEAGQVYLMCRFQLISSLMAADHVVKHLWEEIC